MALSRDSILTLAQPKLEALDVPEMGGVVHLRVMSGAERDCYEREVVKTDFENIRAKLLVRAICDDKGNRFLTDADAEQLGKQPAPMLERLFAVAQRINVLTSEDVDELKKS